MPKETPTEEQQQTEASLRVFGEWASPQLSDARLLRRIQQILDATTDAILFLDRDYNMTFLNRRAKELLAPGGDVVGKNLFDCFPGIIYENSPYVETYRKSMDDGVAGEFEAYYPEPLNLWLRVQSYPADDGIIIFFRDVTEERRAERELQEKRQEAERQRMEIETVYRTAPIGLALFDTKDFRYLRLNDRQAEFFGIPPEQIVGRTLTEMAPIDGLRELFEQVLQGTPVQNHLLEGSLITRPEEHRYWTVSYFPAFAADGSIQAITAASLEITQQKKAEEALIRSEKLAVVGRLASSIAHEINNPLESVTNLIYLAQNSDDIAEVRKYLETAEMELRRASAITSQTLRFHRQSTSRTRQTYGGLMDSVLEIFRGRIMNSLVSVQERSCARVAVECFDGEIRQVLSNLVGNALDAMPRGGRLLLRSRDGTDWATGRRGLSITVADTGSGMSATTLASAFEPFFTTKGMSGTGLGLWISQEIMARHQGRLTVRSSQGARRHGSVFRIFLPLDHAPRL
jgi:signal transduction histidine kinase